MNRLERNRLHAEAIVEKISRNLEIRAVRITEVIDLRKARLYRLLRELRQADVNDKQQRLISRVKNRLFNESVSNSAREQWADTMWR